jgi:hypothetical protein
MDGVPDCVLGDKFHRDRFVQIHPLLASAHPARIICLCERRASIGLASPAGRCVARTCFIPTELIERLA